MSSRHIPEDLRAAAVADYRTSGDTYKVVAARHGVSHSALHSWANPDGPTREDRDDEEAAFAYVGAPEFDPRHWEVRRGVLYPLFPERRSA